MRAEAQVAGHFGEFLQGRLGPGGPLALVTLPCAAATVTALRIGDGGFGAQGCAVPRAALTRFAHALGAPLRGRYMVHTAFPPGAGCGVSTASLLALAQAAGCTRPAPALARACLAAEGASDPLMCAAPGRVLWASRAGRRLASLPPPPRLSVIGGLWGPLVRTRAQDTAFADIRDLVARWPGATARHAAELASESARRNAALRGPEGDPSEAMAGTLGALGFAAAHTGSARAFLFAPGAVPQGADAALAEAGYTHITRFEISR